MQVTNGEELLEKYNLKANDAILAEGKQKEMYVLLFSLHRNYSHWAKVVSPPFPATMILKRTTRLPTWQEELLRTALVVHR